MLLNELHYLHVRCLLAHLRPYLIIEVWAIERTLELGSINDTETLLYVCPHLVGGSCSECNYRCTAYLIYYRTYVPVLRTEVVPPLRNAMCLIYRIE